MLLSSCLIFVSINPVQSLLWLVGVFICASFVLIEMGAEFIAILLVLVYVGAIAVLFLFVIMLLNIRLIELNLFNINYKFIVFFYSFFFLLQIIFILSFKTGSFNFINFDLNTIDFFWLNSLDFTSNIEVIGILLFKIFYYYFFFLSLILLVALLGTIILLVPSSNESLKQT